MALPIVSSVTVANSVKNHFILCRMSELHQRIKFARTSVTPRLSLERLGRACDPVISKAGVGYWETLHKDKRTRPKYENLKTISKETGASIEWLLSDKSLLTLEDMRSSSNVEPGPGLKGDVPIISWVQAGEWEEAIDNFHPGDAERMLPCIAQHSKHTFALRVQGDSMTTAYGKSYPDGSFIFVDPDQRGGVGNGDYVIAKLNGDNKVTFKQYVEDGENRFLKPLNQQYRIIEDEFRILGKVIGMWMDA